MSPRFPSACQLQAVVCLFLIFVIEAQSARTVSSSQTSKEPELNAFELLAIVLFSFYIVGVHLLLIVSCGKYGHLEKLYQDLKSQHDQTDKDHKNAQEASGPVKIDKATSVPDFSSKMVVPCSKSHKTSLVSQGRIFQMVKAPVTSKSNQNSLQPAGLVSKPFVGLATTPSAPVSKCASPVRPKKLDSGFQRPNVTDFKDPKEESFDLVI